MTWRKSGFARELFVITRCTWFRSGNHVQGLSYWLRNLHAIDASFIEARNDILKSSAVIEGPGALLLMAGRDIYNTNAISIGNRLRCPHIADFAGGPGRTRTCNQTVMSG
jgi:hypothetical protein